MTPTPVGMRCPECARDSTRVTTGPTGGEQESPATFVLLALNIAVYLAVIASGGGGLSNTGSSLVADFGLQGLAIADGEWYRLLTGGFLHASIFHLGFNMFALWVIGRILEPGIGTARFVALYFASLFAGSFGAILLTDPVQVTIGASGAIFGIFGALFVIARGRGLNEIASQLGLLLLINLALTFGVPRISIGGHLGGLAAGAICALVLVAGERGKLGARRLPIELGTMVAIALLSIALAISVA